MPDQPFPTESAALLRQAVASLSARTSGEYGDLVPAASPERTHALVRKLEQLAAAGAGVPAAALDAADLETLDSWIRMADSFTLHDDAGEAEARAEAGRRLREFRVRFAPPADHLTADQRGG